MSLKHANSHERDAAIVFDEEPHIYYINGERARTSVTTVVHDFFDKFDADAIIDKMMSGKNWPKSKYNGMTKDEIKAQWAAGGLEATTNGTIMHKAIEDYYNGTEVVNDTIEYAQFLEFAAAHKDTLEPYRTEWEIYDERTNIAGSIDMVFKNVGEDTYSIYDWKRTKEIKKYSFDRKHGKYPMHNYQDCNFVHYSLQLNIYKYMLETRYGIPIKDMYLVCMHPDYATHLKYKVIDLQDEVHSIMENIGVSGP